MWTSTGSSGHLDVVEDARLAGSASSGRSLCGELPGDVGVLGGVFGERGERDGAHVEVLGWRFVSRRRRRTGLRQAAAASAGAARWACEVGELDRGVAEQRLGEVVHGVALLGGDQRVGEHGVEERPGDLDAVLEQHGEVELEVVADLFGGRGEHGAEVGQQGVRPDGRYHASCGLPAKAMPNRREREAVERGGLGVEAEAGLALARVVEQLADCCSGVSAR